MEACIELVSENGALLNVSRYTYLTVAYSHLNRSSVDGIADRQRIDIFYDRPARSQYGEGPIHIT